jgi:hypothetical protein
MASSLSAALLADADALTSSIVAVTISSVFENVEPNSSRAPPLAPPLVLAIIEAEVDENDNDGQEVDSRR